MSNRVLRTLKTISREIKVALMGEGYVTKTPWWTPVERPSVSFSDLVEIVERDSDIRDALDMWAEAVAGPGHYITVEPGYEDVKEEIDGFAEDLDLDTMLWLTARNMVAFGNDFWEIIKPEYTVNLKQLPISTFDSNFVLRSLTGAIEGYKQLGKRDPFPPEKIIHWKWGTVNCSAEGRGLLQAMAVTRSFLYKKKDGTTLGVTIPSVIECKWRIQEDIRQFLHHYLPKAIWSAEVNKTLAQEVAKLIEELEPGERVFTNKPASIATETIATQRGMSAMIDYFDNMIIRALRTPLFKLYTVPGFTEASSRVAEAFFNRSVMSIQRLMKRIVEKRIYYPLAVQRFNPLRARKAKMRLNWGAPEKLEWTMKDIIDCLKFSAEAALPNEKWPIKPQEARKIFIEGGLKLEEVIKEELKVASPH